MVSIAVEGENEEKSNINITNLTQNQLDSDFFLKRRVEDIVIEKVDLNKLHSGDNFFYAM